MSNIGTAASGTVLQGAGTGAAPKFSTATYPVTAGTSGNVLTSDGTNWTSATPSGGGKLILIQSQSASNVAQLDFTGLTTYNTIFITMTNVQPVTNGSYFRILVSSNNGSSYDTSGYSMAFNYFATVSTSTYTNASTTSEFKLSDNIGSGQTFVGSTMMYNLNIGSGIIIQGNMVYTDSSANFRGGLFYGKGNSGINALRFSMNSGNINTGIVTIYGYATS